MKLLINNVLVQSYILNQNNNDIYDEVVANSNNLTMVFQNTGQDWCNHGAINIAVDDSYVIDSNISQRLDMNLCEERATCNSDRLQKYLLE